MGNTLTVITIIISVTQLAYTKCIDPNEEKAEILTVCDKWGDDRDNCLKTFKCAWVKADGTIETAQIPQPPPRKSSEESPVTMGRLRSRKSTEESPVMISRLHRRKSTELIPEGVVKAMDKVDELWKEEWDISDDPEERQKQQKSLEHVFNAWKEASYGRGWFARHPVAHDLSKFFLDVGVNFVIGGGVGGAVTAAVAGGGMAFGTGVGNAVVETFGGYAGDEIQHALIGKKIKHPKLKMFWDAVVKSTISGASSGAGSGLLWGQVAGGIVGFVFPPLMLASIPGGAAGGALIGGITGGIVGFAFGVASEGIKCVMMRGKIKKLKASAAKYDDDAAKYDDDIEMPRLFLFEQLPIEYQKRLLFTLDAMRILRGQYFDDEEKAKMRKHRVRTKIGVYKTTYSEPRAIVIDSSKDRTVEQTIDSTMSFISSRKLIVKYDGEPVLPVVADMFKKTDPTLKTDEPFIPIPSDMEIPYSKSKIDAIAKISKHLLCLSIPDLDIRAQWKQLFDGEKPITGIKIQRGETTTSVTQEIPSGFKYVEIPHRIVLKKTSEAEYRKIPHPIDPKKKHEKKSKVSSSNSYHVVPDFSTMNHNTVDYYENEFKIYLYAIIVVLTFIICCCCLLYFITSAIVGFVAYYVGKWIQTMSDNKNNSIANNYESVSVV